MAVWQSTGKENTEEKKGALSSYAFSPAGAQSQGTTDQQRKYNSEAKYCVVL